MIIDMNDALVKDYALHLAYIAGTIAVKSLGQYEVLCRYY